MKKTFAILLASTALAVGAGIPAWSSMYPDMRREAQHKQAAGTTLVSDDDGVDQDHGPSLRRDDDDDHYDYDDDGDDNDNESSQSANPAPAGTVAPPANGLFGSGATPKANVN